MPLAWRATLALDGEEDFEAIGLYVESVQGQLEKLSDAAGSGTDEARQLGELRMFLSRLEKALATDGDTRRTLKLQKRRGRERQSLAHYLRGSRAAAAVERLVAEGWKQEAAIESVRKQEGLSRTEMFKWLKRRRDDDQAWTEFYSE